MRIRWKLPRIRPVSLILILVGATVLWFLVLSRPRRGLGDQLDPLKYEHLKRDYFDVPDSVEYVGPFPDSKVPEGVQLELVDYHDYEQVKRDKARVGLGEQGRPAKVPPGNKALEDKLYLDNGFNGLLSDYIALDRSLPDIRHPACASYKYYKNLPTTSVVIPFFEESLSALQRTIVSVVNRTPAHLLKEIILVDDGSFKNPDLKAPLEAWLRASAPKARLLRLPEREGLITARMAGAKAAIGDVIVVLDSHCEVLVNWLPPLLHPIVEDHRVAVCPLIDVIAWDTFAYHAQDDGARGAFDWNFFYKRIPLAADVAATLPRPFQNPVMNGGLFAISRAFFWELGGYDPELAIWGGEQYNLSFKIWQCGGRLYDAPCSRVGHVFRGGRSNRPAAKKGDFTNRNYKRVALVWMDEYIEALYRKKPSLRSLDAGDVTEEWGLRKRLQCKSFKWFLETVAPDLLRVYPPFEDPDFANGTIRNTATGQCLDTGGKSTGAVIQHPCHGGSTQQFFWCWREFIRTPNEQFCLEAPQGGGAPFLYNCNNNDAPAKMRWTYDPVTGHLRDAAGGRCLEASGGGLLMGACAPTDTQRWTFQHLNTQRLGQAFPHLA